MSQSPNPSPYLIDEDLKAVVEMAIELGLPLLVTGEPGTGKTRLAHYVAAEMLQAELTIFNTKTTSQSRDLLYHYNTLTHFRDSRQGEQVNPLEYITFQGLGKAILDARKAPQVVLVDEIDKAPRDFPNDVLFEFDEKSFQITEAAAPDVKAFAEGQGWGELVDDKGIIRMDKGSHPLFLILTSNSEKNLPDAFLRRCAYFHIPPPKRERLIEIVQKHLSLDENFKENMLDHAIDHFLEIRKKGLRKKPATAELLSWIHVLNKHGINPKTGIDGEDEQIRQIIRQSYSLLTKNKEDRDRILAEMKLT